MAGFSIIGTILAGIGLVVSGWLAPDNILAWFSAPEAQMVVWRLSILAGLVLLAVVREVSDNRTLRTVWAAAGLSLAWVGFNYLLDNAAYIFDALYMLAAAACFGAEALQTTEQEATPSRLIHYGKLVYVQVSASARFALANKHSTRNLLKWPDLQDTSHRLVLGTTWKLQP